MPDLWASFQTWLAAWWTAEQTASFIRALVLVAAGLVLSRLARLALERGFAKHLSRQQFMLARRIVFYTILGLFLVSALRELNFNLSVLLGAAGIVTVALGFASQTSASNLISGLFLVFEGVVEVGDVIKVDAITGEVLSVDLLSTKLRTFDNLLVRIPNETMVKANITNFNRFPIRRVDVQIAVSYDEDLERVIRTVLKVAEANPLCLDEPAPLILAQGFAESAVTYQFGVWAKTENWLELRNSMQKDIKAAFDEAGIVIPFPQRTLHFSSAEAFPARFIPAERPEGED